MPHKMVFKKKIVISSQNKNLPFKFCSSTLKLSFTFGCACAVFDIDFPKLEKAPSNRKNQFFYIAI